MEMRFIGNTDKKERSNRRLAKKLAGVLLAGAMIATNFGGVEPGVAHAANLVELTDLSQLTFSQDCYYLGEPNTNIDGYILKDNIVSLNSSMFLLGTISIDLNGHTFSTPSFDTFLGNLCIMDSSSAGNGSINDVCVYSGRNLTVSGGIVSISNNNGTVIQTGGTVNFNYTIGTYIQTGGTNSYNKDITLDPNGGTLATTTVKTHTVSGVENLYSIPEAPTSPSANLAFDGWFTSPDGGDQVTLTTPFTSDATIYAHWTNTSTTSGTNPPTISVTETDNPPVDLTKDYLDELTDKLEVAIKAGGPQTIYWNEGTALPGPVMKLLQENPQITLVFSYTYEGLDYVVTLPGKYVKYDPNVPWCGPLYLYGLYGKYGTTTAPVATTTQAGERSYTVISGETLWGIAMRLGTTVEELVRLNNITNPDRIDIGQIIRY